MKRKTKPAWFFVWLCYGAVMLLWLGWCTVHWGMASWQASQGAMAPRSLTPEDFAPGTSGVAFSQDWEHHRYFTTTDADAQLHLVFPGGAPVGQFVFDARAVNKVGGDMALYYTTRPDQPFSEERKLPARQNAQGQWAFDLNGRRIHALRLDPDSVGGVYWQVYDVILNAEKPALAYFAPDALQVAVLLFAPVLLYAVAAQLAAFLQPVFARRRLERRWQQGEDIPKRRKTPGRKPAAKMPPRPALPKKPSLKEATPIPTGKVVAPKGDIAASKGIVEAPNGEATPKADPAPKAKPAPKAETASKAEPAPMAEPEPTADPAPKAEPAPEADSEPKADSTPTGDASSPQENAPAPTEAASPLPDEEAASPMTAPPAPPEAKEDTSDLASKDNPTHS